MTKEEKDQMYFSDKICMILGGINFELNSQNQVFSEFKNVEGSTYPKVFMEHQNLILDKLRSVYEDVLDFSNARDINTEQSVLFHESILNACDADEFA